MLFDRADIAVETQQSKLNAAGMDHSTGTGMKHFRISGRSFERRKLYSFRGKSYSFRPSYSGGFGGYGAYGYGSQKGKGKGKSYKGRGRASASCSAQYLPCAGSPVVPAPMAGFKLVGATRPSGSLRTDSGWGQATLVQSPHFEEDSSFPKVDGGSVDRKSVV